MRATEFILEYKPVFGDPTRFKEPEKQLDVIVRDLIKQGSSPVQARERALDWLMNNNPRISATVAADRVSESIARISEGNSENANALVGSGRADPHGKKTNTDSTSHKKVRTPTTTYSKDRKKYNNGAPPGANDGFVG